MPPSQAGAGAPVSQSESSGGLVRRSSGYSSSANAPIPHGRSYLHFGSNQAKPPVKRAAPSEEQQSDSAIAGTSGISSAENNLSDIIGSFTAEREEIRDGSARLASLSLLRSSPGSPSEEQPSTDFAPGSSPQPLPPTSPSAPSNLARQLQKQQQENEQAQRRFQSTLGVNGSSPDGDSSGSGGSGTATPTPSKPGTPPRASQRDERAEDVDQTQRHSEERSKIVIVGDQVGGTPARSAATSDAGSVTETDDDEDAADERSPLFKKKGGKPKQKRINFGQWSASAAHTLASWRPTPKVALQTGREAVESLPAVLLGVLMNVLDGVSYGMITFPTSMAAFENFGGIGVSMFFVSCVVSQIVYSGGGSIFKSGNGSMMIEVVPFYHSIATIVANSASEDNSIVATTMMAYAVSSLLMGVAFFLLGVLKLGSLCEFFPRHILVGCIGGVGAFLIVTGFQVSARLSESAGFWTKEVFMYLFSLKIFPLWLVPLLLAIALRVITEFYSHPAIMPAYFISVPIVFYIITAAAHVPLTRLRELGWVFEVNGVDNKWYEYFTYYDFKRTDWSALLDTIPTQFALVFFGLLHVPVNVPALAISVGEDNVDTNRELIAHGLSNGLAGLLGTVPNYLCYVNSVLFIRIGGTTRVSGFMLALACTGILLVGPGVIGYLPVCVVGALIFILGIDLVREAVWDTYHRVARSEYVTIWVIIITMTAYDFVVGIGVGIILACVSFVVSSSRRRAIRAIWSGDVARSVVRRHPKQSAFLKKVGSQTRVIKLQGFLFFGTISACETTIRRILEAASWTAKPVRFLVLDFSMASGVDFSAAEAFVRIHRLLEDKGVTLAFAGCGPDSGVGIALRSVDLWAGSATNRVEVFENLNNALEHCENAYLRTLYSRDFGPPQIQDTTPMIPTGQIDVPKIESPNTPSFAQSPRMSHLHSAAKETFNQPTVPELSRSGGSSKTRFQQPIPLLLQSLRPFVPDINEDFCFRLLPYFKRVEVARGGVVWDHGDMADSFYVIESGMLKAEYLFLDKTHAITESMVAGTIAGETSFLARTQRNARATAERDTVLWKLDIESHERMGAKEGWAFCQKLSQTLLRVAVEEQETLMCHLISSM